jgi:hypothetical protein
MISEIFIENRRVDINSDLSSLLTFALDDIKSFANRSTSFSKTIVLPGTSNNHLLFGHVFDISVETDHNPLLSNIGYNFNAAKSARCLIFQDNIQTFKGTVRLLEIVKIHDTVEYEVALHGEIAGLNVALSDGLLEDLDFSAYDHTYNHTNIIASWDNIPGSGYYYPTIDHGGYSTDKHNWNIRTFRPALYVKEYLDKMFEAANFRYQSDLFNTDRFKGLIIPYNRKILTSFAQFSFQGSGVANSQPMIDLTVGKTMESIVFTTVTTSVFDPPDAANRYYYNGSIPATYRVKGTVTGKYTDPYGELSELYVEDVNGRQNVYSGMGTDVPFTYNFDFTKTFNPGDYFELRFITYTMSTDPLACYGTILTATTTMTPEAGAGVEISPGGTVVMNDCIPRNIRQIDILVSIVRLFNLYVYEDQFDSRLIYFKPYVDFYESEGAVDWTYKLNRDKPIRLKPMAELTAKNYDFKYKGDTDYYNDLYKKRYSHGYGDYRFNTEYEFAENNNSFELIFSGTPLVGYTGEDKVYSTIFKQNNNNEESTDYNIRILQTKKIDVTSWNILNGTTVLASPVVYGYAGHFNDPTSPTDDLNFGVPYELFYDLAGGNLTNTQFNVYWSVYMAEVTDKDSKLLQANFYLTPKDIFSLRFSKYVLVDGVLFRLNRITDYNASNPDDCRVELLKVINTDYSFPPRSTIPSVTSTNGFYLLAEDGILLEDYNGQNIYYLRLPGF